MDKVAMDNVRADVACEVCGADFGDTRHCERCCNHPQKVDRLCRCGRGMARIYKAVGYVITGAESTAPGWRYDLMCEECAAEREEPPPRWLPTSY